MPSNCSFKQKGEECTNSPEFIIEIVSYDSDEKFMIGLTCFEHKKDLDIRFKLLQKNGKIPNGKIDFVRMNIIHTQCVKGNQDDIDEITLQRYG